jgi:hypothetical protein
VSASPRVVLSNMFLIWDVQGAYLICSLARLIRSGHDRPLQELHGKLCDSAREMIQMGLIRKTASLSTFGGVKYTSRREAQTKEALAQAKLAKEERTAVRHERKAEGTEHRVAEAEQREQAAEGLPRYRQPTLGAAIAAARKNKGNDHADGHHEA